MAEDETTAEVEDTPTETTPDEKPVESLVPQKALHAERERRKAEANRASELEAKLAEIEDRDKSEVERLTAQLERAQKASDAADKRAADLEATVARQTRSSYVRKAAEQVGIDGDVAVAMVTLDDAEDDATATRLVKELAKSKPSLVQKPSGEPQLSKVLKDGSQARPAEEEGMSRQDRDNESLRAIYGASGASIWDADEMIRLGGGVSPAAEPNQ